MSTLVDRFLSGAGKWFKEKNELLTAGFFKSKKDLNCNEWNIYILLSNLGILLRLLLKVQFNTISDKSAILNPQRN